jgi:hypothetical protein
MELEVNGAGPKVPEVRLPGFGVTLLIIDVRPLICMTKVPLAGPELPENEKVTWLEVMATEQEQTGGRVAPAVQGRPNIEVEYCAAVDGLRSWPAERHNCDRSRLRRGKVRRASIKPADAQTSTITK